jgi:hypothetical protein
MRVLKILSLLLLGIVAMFSAGCDDDDIDVALINFTSESYDVDPVTLDPVTVELSLQPAAGSASSVTINFSGGEGTFTTSPASSGNTLELPVAQGDRSVSFTVTFDRASLPDENVQVDMALGTPGPNLGTGITTSASINVPFLNLQTIPYAEAFGGADVSSCDEVTFPPAGWVVETVEGDPTGQGTWRCITGAEGAFTHTGTGVEANAFLTGETIDAWLISPILGPITASTTMDVGLDIRFDPNGGFPYDVEVLTSTDYNGLNFGSATWEVFTEATDTWLANDFEADDVTIYTIDLGRFEGEAITIAFRYICPDNGNCGVARFDDFTISN